MNCAARILLLALGVVLALGPGPSAQEEEELYVCRDEHGNVSFQTDPCPEISKSKVAPPPPAPKRTKPRASSRTKATATPPATPNAPAQVPPRTTSWRKIPAAQRAPRAPRRKVGKASFPTSLDGAALPARPSYASPQHTWRTFLGAIERGDTSGVLACLSPSALERLGADAESFALEQLRETLSRFTRIENEGDLGPFWSIRGVRASRRPKWVLFEKTGAREWKIAGI